MAYGRQTRRQARRQGRRQARRQAAAVAPERVLVAFFQKHAGPPKGLPRPIRQISVTKFVAYPSCI